MPIPVKCPSCSHKFSVKDEYAGKRAKCPECEEPLSIPGGAAPMPAARPKSSPIAKALDDEAAESPKAKRRRDEDDDDLPRAKKRRDDDEGDEKPRARKRREDDEDEDDRPKGNRRRRDDDEPPKKKKGSALPLILGIVAGVVLLCCGGPLGVWFIWIKPGLESAASGLQAWASEVKQEQAAKNSFKDNFQKVKAGMTKKEVDDLLGPNSAKAQEHDVGRVTMMLSDWPKSDDRWKPKAKAGHVLVWDKSGDGVLVAYSTDPNAGGTVVGAVGNFGLSASEPIKLPAAEPTGDVNNPVATLTADEVTGQFDRYRDRWVTVSGTFRTVDNLNPFSVVLTTPPGFTLTVHPPTGGRFPLADPQVQLGESLTFTGKVGGDKIAIQLKEAKFVRRTGGTPPVKPSNALTTADLVRDHAKLRGQTVTLRGKVKLVIDDTDRKSGHLVFDTGSGAIGVQARIPDGKWRTQFYQGEDTIELTGIIGGLAGNPGSGQYVELLNGDVLKRTDKAGRDVPLPPVTPPPPAKPVAVNSETLVADFAQNADAANKKYADKLLTVTGTVEKVSPTGSSVTLKGLAAADNKKAYVITVGMGFAGRDEAKKLKEGDPVKLTGKFTLFRAASGTTPNTVALTNGAVEK